MSGTVRTVAYGSHPDQVCDLRLPETDGPHPVVVLIHGGFWRARWRRDLMDPLAEELRRHGCATWNVEYRRVGMPGGGWPGTFSDVALAMDSLRDPAEDLPLDLARTTVMGHSAGGHLALWTAARSGLPAGVPGAAPELTPWLVVPLGAVCDLRDAVLLHLGGGAVVDLLGEPDRFPERYALASPAERLPLGVAQLLVHGTADDTVPHDHALRYRGAAAAAGDDATLLSIDGAGHFDVIDPATTAWARTLEALHARGAVR